VTPTSIDYSKNNELQGLNSLQILDNVMTEMDKQGLYILLDHHRPDCQAISELWYTSTYSEQNWIDDLVWVAKRYKDNAHFFGIDLKNEPHGTVSWGTNNASTDWRLASQKAATAITAVNNNVVFFVEGIQENPSCSSNTAHWWGGNLEPVTCAASEIDPKKLVFSPHVYGPDVSGQSYFNDADFPKNMPAIWDKHFGYLVAKGHAVIFGEFGGKYGHGGSAKDKIWQDALVDYMTNKGLTNFFYWTWNPNSGDTGGILKDDWSSIWDDKLALLKRLMGNTSSNTSGAITPTSNTSTNTVPNTPTTSPVPVKDTTTKTPQTFAATDACQVSYLIDSQWQDGMVVRFSIKNQTNSQIDGWRLQWVFPQTTQIVTIWNATKIVNTESVVINNESWNRVIAANASTEFGLQLQGQNLQLPTSASLTCNLSSVATNNLTNNNDNYQQGYQAGIAYCQKNPAACAIQTTCATNASNTTAVSKTQYQSKTGRLTLPSVSIVNTQGETYWQAEMEYVNVGQCVLLQSDSVLFKVTDVKPLQTP
jgi:endoglucanase